MIDIITGNKVVVEWDEECGVYAPIFSYQDLGALQDVLEGERLIPCDSMPIKELSLHGGGWLYFGVLADLKKAQTILDEIVFDWSDAGWKELLELREEQIVRFGADYYKKLV